MAFSEPVSQPSSQFSSAHKGVIGKRMGSTAVLTHNNFEEPQPGKHS